MGHIYCTIPQQKHFVEKKRKVRRMPLGQLKFISDGGRCKFTKTRNNKKSFTPNIL